MGTYYQERINITDISYSVANYDNLTVTWALSKDSPRFCLHFKNDRLKSNNSMKGPSSEIRIRLSIFSSTRRLRSLVAIRFWHENPLSHPAFVTGITSPIASRSDSWEMHLGEKTG